MHLRPAVDEGDAGAMTPEVERGDGGGVLAADDEDVEAEVRMRLVVIVLHLGEVLAGNVEVVGQVVIARRDHQLARAELEAAVETVDDVDCEVAIGAGDALDRFVLTDVEGVVLGDFAVVFEGFAAGGLLVGAGEGHVADLEQFRRGEKGHVRGVVEERVAEATLVDERGGEARALGLDGAGHACGTGSDDEQIGHSQVLHRSDRPLNWIGFATASILREEKKRLNRPRVSEDEETIARMETILPSAQPMASNNTDEAN